jgi:uncharacterized metal-binding protein
MRLAAASAALLTVLCGQALILCGQALAQERWAAIAPNQENSSEVVWATTKDQAKKLAVLACKQASSTCAETPASTNGMDHVFAVMCCTDPKAACAAGVGASRDTALKEVKVVLLDGGYSKCELKSYFKAGTGEKG